MAHFHEIPQSRLDRVFDGLAWPTAIQVLGDLVHVRTDLAQFGQNQGHSLYIDPGFRRFVAEGSDPEKRADAANGLRLGGDFGLFLLGDAGLNGRHPLSLAAAAHGCIAHPIREGWGRVGEGGTPLLRGSRGGTLPARVDGARPLVMVQGRNGMVRVHGRNALGRYPKAARFGRVHGAQRLAWGSNGGRRTPLQDEAEPGGGATAAHLAVRSTNKFSALFLWEYRRIADFRNSIMR